MIELPEDRYAPILQNDDREAGPLTGSERETLTTVLDFQRRTFELKFTGVPRERFSEKAIPPSDLSFHGLVRHLAGAERWWFRQQFAGEKVPMLFFTMEHPHADFEDLDGDIEEAVGVWRSECDAARAVVAATESLDATGVQFRTGEPIALRTILVHMIAEYARHNGHADILREQIDGSIGF